MCSLLPAPAPCGFCAVNCFFSTIGDFSFLAKPIVLESGPGAGGFERGSSLCARRSLDTSRFDFTLGAVTRFFVVHEIFDALIVHVEGFGVAKHHYPLPFTLRIRVNFHPLLRVETIVLIV